MKQLIDSDIIKACSALSRGEPVFIYDADGREEETDIVMASEFIGPRDIMLLRKDGGGLICSTVNNCIA